MGIAVADVVVLAARLGEALSSALDLPNRRATVVAKGGNAEVVGWWPATAHLLPRYLAGRATGPLFPADRRPSPARQPARGDVDPTTGRARRSYRRAAHLFAGASGGWTLHQLRHSRLTHLAAGIGLLLLMAKSRHASIKTLAVYARPSFDDLAEATARLDPVRRRASRRG